MTQKRPVSYHNHAPKSDTFIFCFIKVRKSLSNLHLSIYVYICTTYFRDEYFTLKTNMEAHKEWKYSQHTITAG